MKDSSPKISVIIPMFNSGHFMPDALKSIAQQRYDNIEIIVVDDGSTDDSVEFVKRLGYDVNIIQQTNSGPAAARNTGLEAASGELIAFLDSDDLFPENKFSIQLQMLQDKPELQLIAGRIQYIFMEGSDQKVIHFESDQQTMVHVHLGSMLTRREVFDQIGVFEASLTYSEDIEWWLRVREQKINYAILPDITLLYRLHDSNMTNGLRGVERDFMRALRMSLQRRRASGEMTIAKLSDKDLKQ